MENVTHSLVGLLLARTGLNRWARGATAVLILSANAPDADIVVAPWGALRYLEVHRGYTHCLVGLPFMAALAVVVTAAGLRRNIPWLRLWLAACLGVGSHLLLDWTNSYGVRLLLPFSSRWLHADISSLWDGVVLAVLLVAAVWPWFARLVSSEIGAGRGRADRGRGIAFAAMACYLIFECFRAVLHGRAVDELSARIYGGELPISTAAMPGPINPFRWAGIVETPNSFRSLDVNLDTPLEADFARVLYKPALDRPIQMALVTEPFRYMRYFAGFPAWSELPVSLPQGQGIRVELTDLRFGGPGVGSFHAIALVSSDGRILDSAFTFSSGAGIGYGMRR